MNKTIKVAIKALTEILNDSKRIEYLLDLLDIAENDDEKRFIQSKIDSILLRNIDIDEIVDFYDIRRELDLCAQATIKKPTKKDIEETLKYNLEIERDIPISDYVYDVLIDELKEILKELIFEYPEDYIIIEEDDYFRIELN